MARAKKHKRTGLEDHVHFLTGRQIRRKGIPAPSVLRPLSELKGTGTFGGYTQGSRSLRRLIEKHPDEPVFVKPGAPEDISADLLRPDR